MSNEKDRIKVYEDAISTYGIEPQVNMIYEEVGELITALSRFKRGRCDGNDILTELADVSIMVEQIAVILGYDGFEKEKDIKLNRLIERLKKRHEHKGENSDFCHACKHGRIQYNFDLDEELVCEKFGCSDIRNKVELCNGKFKEE